MKDLLAMLVELQQFDDALRDTRALQQRIETLSTENASSLELFDQMLAERGSRIDDVRAFIAEKTDELTRTEEATRRSRARMGAISSQRELSAVNKELDIQRRMNHALTGELTKLREELAEAEADHAKKQAERDTIAEQMKALETELRAQLETKLASGSDIQGRRDALRATMPARERGRYDRVAKARNGKAVADVLDGCCAACKMQVPPHQLQKVMRATSMEMCQSCQRMLVWFDGILGTDDVVDVSE